jgi:ankyrin repeat protein
VSDPKALDSNALRWAAANGHLEIVKLLIPVSDPKAGGSYALRLAAENGHLEIVKLLIPVSDPEVVKELGLN